MLVRNTVSTILTAVQLLALSLCLCGCTPFRVTANTTEALYDPRTDPHFDRKLVGIWLPEYLCVNLEKGDGNAYLLRNGVFGGLPGIYDPSQATQPIHLVKIGKYDYFFAAPKPGEPGTSLTNCCRVDWCKDRIAIRNLNFDAILDDLEKHPGTLKYEWQEAATTDPNEPTTSPSTRPSSRPGVPTSAPATQSGVHRNGHLQITDEPRAIRAYLIKRQDDPDLFLPPAVLLRIR